MRKDPLSRVRALILLLGAVIALALFVGAVSNPTYPDDVTTIGGAR